MKLSAHFTKAEFEKTSQPYDNIIPWDKLVKAVYLAARMEKVREILGSHPIIVNSAYRSPEVNKAVGGTSSSQHLKLEAVDFVCPKFGSAYEVAKELAQKVGELNYDQLIYEQTWVHISFTADRTPRNQNLTYLRGKYSQGINQ